VDVGVAWKLGDQPIGWFHLNILAYKTAGFVVGAENKILVVG